ncbi:MAG: NUDIX domain-containing protein [Patescibacteria group bacterium]
MDYFPTKEEIEKLMFDRKRIPDDVFREVLKWVPISTSDFILTRKNEGGKKEFLLGYRTEAPFKDTWFVPGGRLNWGETPDEACYRHLQRELGIQYPAIEFQGHFSVINPESDDRPLWHSIWHLYEVPVPFDTIVTPNKENAKVEWFTHIDSSWPEPVQNALRSLGFLWE